MPVKNFWELEVWKLGHALVIQIYTITKTFPIHEQFGITSQIRRASSSITANIAEGFERYHFKDKNKFYYQARGSISEVQNFIFLARDLNYINKQTSRELGLQTSEVHKLLNGLIRSTEQHIQ